MSVIQYGFSTGFLAALLGMAWFSVHVVSATLKVNGFVGIWRLVGSRPGQIMDLGQWAYCCHRISGVGIFIFLCLHVLNVSLYSISHDLYNEVHVLYLSSPMRFMECGLLLAILFHSFNGIRLLILDLVPIRPGAGERLLKLVFWLSLVVAGSGSVIILRPVFQ